MRLPRTLTAAVVLVGAFAYGFLFGQAKARGDRPPDPEPEIKTQYLSATPAQIDEALITRGALPPARPKPGNHVAKVQDLIDACEMVNQSPGADVHCAEIVTLSEWCDEHPGECDGVRVIRGG